MANEPRPGHPHAAPARGRKAIDRRAFDKPLWILLAACALLFAVDPLVEKHPYFDVEHWWAFYGLWSFVSCLALVFAALLLRLIVRRPEGYYDR